VQLEKAHRLPSTPYAERYLLCIRPQSARASRAVTRSRHCRDESIEPQSKPSGASSKGGIAGKPSTDEDRPCNAHAFRKVALGAASDARPTGAALAGMADLQAMPGAMLARAPLGPASAPWAASRIDTQGAIARSMVLDRQRHV